MRREYIYEAEVNFIVDGDTVDVTVDLGMGFFKKTRMRLLNFDAWEVKGGEKEKGLLAKAALDALLSTCQYRVFIETMKDPTDKYGRLLGILYDPANGRSINDEMKKHWERDPHIPRPGIVHPD